MMGGRLLGKRGQADDFEGCAVPSMKILVKKRVVTRAQERVRMGGRKEQLRRGR